jgi:hypothetical protein
MGENIDSQSKDKKAISAQKQEGADPNLVGESAERALESKKPISVDKTVFGPRSSFWWGRRG